MAVSRCVSMRKFIDLLSFTKYKEILALTKTDVDIEAWLKYAESDHCVDLTSAMTAAGLSNLVIKGVITEQDRQDVLNYIPLNY